LGSGLVLAKVLTCAVVGLDGAIVEVEADIGPGLHRREVARRSGPGVPRAGPGGGQELGL
jgi:hypothetical protein